ncbi:MAG: hypothetical protein IJT62_08775 [Oscillospiraceae bacterium]|nr:hypothetical protein [Oscillospiraceae bacterium]
MKRWKLLFPALVLALLLAGCEKKPREVENEPWTVRLDALTEASFTGTADPRDGTADGRLTGADSWRFEGTLRGEELLDGTCEALPCRLTVAGETFTGRYTGPIVGGLPEGEGTAELAGGTFTGTFAAGELRDGEAASLPADLRWCDSDYAGTYTGDLVGGLPEGEGVFEGKNAVGQSLCWNGGWAEGEPAGTGELLADRLLTMMEGQTCAGAYEGAGADGLPEGEGRFTSVSGEGVAFTYEGAWSAGAMDGQGALRYEGENYYLRRGTFTAGCYTPTWMEALASLGTGEAKFELTPERIEFLNAHPELWEEEDHENFFYSRYVSDFDSRLTIWDCLHVDGAMDVPRWMRIYTLRVIRANVVRLSPAAPEMTVVTVSGGSYVDVVRLIIPQRIDYLSRTQPIHVFAVPLAVSEYTTVLGETRPCLVMLAGDGYYGIQEKGE